MDTVKIAVTGGHLTPALAVIDEIRSIHPDWEILFIGRKTVFEGSQTLSEEERIITGKNIQFYALTTGRIRRTFDLLMAKSLVKIPVGLWQAFVLCRKHHPDVILSFGGYIAVPVAFAAWLQNIPVITHEQTSPPGLANRLIARLSKVVCVSTAEAKSHFGHRNVVVTGLPLRRAISHPPPTPGFDIALTRPLIYIMGGVTGSEFINTLAIAVVRELLASYTVIHQVGRQWISQAKEFRQSLRGDKRKFYTIAPYFDEYDHAWILHHASLVISRSGANTVAELEALHIPAIVIPIPNTSGNEQVENALRLEKEGIATLLDQSSATPSRLIEEIGKRVGIPGKRYNPNTNVQNPSRLILDQIEKSL
jgi:UDP-N-acetylglucosamine--N-acetylmuramyl-(pentapeptide) pyrophosphoryl-undecaprenol N-acetylglucosamine transferase